jgi:hypothetical protein
VSGEHRSAERGLYDRLQREELKAAREFLEGRLDDTTFTYDEICRACKSSGLFEDVKDITPQDLTRYRQRRARVEQRRQIAALMESDAAAILEGATKNPTGVLAQFVRRQLTEHIATRFDSELYELEVVDVSREAARHALVEQRDRKLDLDAEKLRIEEKRLELQRQQQDLQKDKFSVAAKTWQFILSWLAKVDAAAVDRLTRHSDDLLTELEVYIETNV